MQKSKGKRRKGASRYAAKVKSGNMMYGPGCCGHRIKVRSEDIPNARRLRGEEESKAKEVDIRADYAQLEARVYASLSDDQRRQLRERTGTLPALEAS